jgi:hypothetical protein
LAWWQGKAAGNHGFMGVCHIGSDQAHVQWRALPLRWPTGQVK